jgi:hypothetical protein
MKSSSDPRYSTIKVLINSGHIVSFRDIFDYIPKTIVYKDLHVNFKRFSKAILNPSALTLGELIELAEMFGLESKLIIEMAFKQIPASKSKSKRTRTR